MPRGGKRLGAGTKLGFKYPKTIEKEEARLAFRAIVQAHADQMHAAQIAHAKGLSYLVARNKKSGKFVKLTQEIYTAILDGKDSEHEAIEVWPKDPSIQAYTDLMNRYMDKPKEQPQELDIKGDHVLTIRIEKPW